MSAWNTTAARWAAAAAIATALGGTLTGCVGTASALDAVGAPLSALNEVREAGSPWVVVLDLSQPVLGSEPTYTGSESTDDWTVVAQCAAAETQASPGTGIIVGVVPAAAATDEILNRARDEAYTDDLAGCA